MESSMQIPCKSSPRNAFPYVNYKCKIAQTNHCFSISIALSMQFQGYEKDIAVLKKTYFTNLTDPDTLKQQNLAFISDLNIGYSVVKATILQTKANYYNNACMSNRNSVFIFRLEQSSELKYLQLIFIAQYCNKIKKNRFLNRFNVHAALNVVAITTKTIYDGAAHGDELCYMFR